MNRLTIPAAKNKKLSIVLFGKYLAVESRGEQIALPTAPAVVRGQELSDSSVFVTVSM